ncbi:hypothetical protein NQ318_017928 [Aromia moschata]|uniref:Uncharacterized protein n=1 Tax=Aromia moschata TaxID=1265417 RepID=A0AAV8YE73_9CUCU|nr:hypothetical protein NQ318_017928 [Aromia moschata]
MIRPRLETNVKSLVLLVKPADPGGGPSQRAIQLNVNNRSVQHYIARDKKSLWIQSDHGDIQHLSCGPVLSSERHEDKGVSGII